MRKVFNSLMMMTAAMMIFAVFSGCGGKKDAAGAAGGRAGGGGRPGAGEGAAVFAVSTTVAVQGQISDYIDLSGDLISGSTVDTYSDAAGKIVSLNVSAGSYVTRGAPIGVVDPSKPGMAYTLHTVRAPISGTVISLPAEVGMTISQATSLAKISGGGGLEVQLYVPERFISKVSRNLGAQITLDAWPGELFRGSVSEISPTVDVASRTEMIKVNVDNPGARLKAGMFAKVKIITESKNNIVKIPSASIVQREGKSVVFVVTPDPTDPDFKIAHQIDVTAGIQIDNVVEIQDGLEAGDEVVARGMNLLTDGARVNVVQKDAGVKSDDINSTGSGVNK
jgi:multidrug efflux pump subunit AcrA (membrane-fusion protein)